MPSMVVCRRLRRFSERRALALSACTSACEARSAASAAPRTFSSAWALRSKPVRLTDTDVIAYFVVLLMACIPACRRLQRFSWRRAPALSAGDLFSETCSAAFAASEASYLS